MAVVLIIDDDWMNLELVEAFLVKDGHTVHMAATAAKGLAAAAGLQPAVILCDVRLGNDSGYDVCAALKTDPATRAIPVIILTAYERPEERAKALAAGADDFISKMGNMPLVVQRVRELSGG